MLLQELKSRVWSEVPDSVCADVPAYYGIASTDEIIHVNWLPIWDVNARFWDRIGTKAGAHLTGRFQSTMNCFNIVYVREQDNFFKLDAHSRSEAIKHGFLTGEPSKVQYVLSVVDNLEGANNLFLQIDNKSSVDTSAVLFRYAIREVFGYDFKFRHPILNKRLTALRLAKGNGSVGGSYTEEQMVTILTEYKRELRKMDSFCEEPLDEKTHGKRLLSSVVLGVLFHILKDGKRGSTDAVEQFLEQSLIVDQRIRPIYNYIHSDEPMTDTNALRKRLFNEWLGRFNAYLDGVEYH